MTNSSYAVYIKVIVHLNLKYRQPQFQLQKRLALVITLDRIANHVAFTQILKDIIWQYNIF